MHDRAVSDLLSGGWRDLVFEAFRNGVEIYWIVRGSDDGPSVALLKYAPGASVPRHRHAGLETIAVLDGAQSDERGVYPKGTFVFNPAGSIHSVSSDNGCVVLIQWERPVVFVDS